MKITTWYNPTLDKYITEYRQFILVYEPGYINNQGHILIGNTFFYDKKVFFDREARENYFIGKIKSAKNRVKKKLINFIDKL